MNYIGKFISNFRDFYNEINAATLTGAIDVLVVEREDGTFACSPFHVRFGKLGVLRAREKVVDIEINGEPADIHMKLGEAGEAFFVEELEEEEDCPAHLATSPIPSSTFLDHLPSIRSTTDDTISTITLTSETITMIADQADADVSLLSTPRCDASVQTEGEEDATDETPKTQTRSEEGQDVPTLPLEADTMGTDPRSQPQTQTQVGAAAYRRQESQKRKKRRRGVVSGPNQSGPGGSAGRKRSLQQQHSVQYDREEEQFEMEDVEVTRGMGRSATVATALGETQNTKETDAKEEEAWSRRMSRSMGPDFHFFSDTEVSPAGSPLASRPSSPVQSDTEYERQHSIAVQTEIVVGSGVEMIGRDAHHQQASWRWGELPSPAVPAAASKSLPMGRPGVGVDLSRGGHDDVVSSDEDDAAALAAAQKEQKAAQQRWILGGMFNFMRKTKHQRAAEGVYLDDLKLEELDAQQTALYFPSSYRTGPSDMRDHNGTTPPSNSATPSPLPNSATPSPLPNSATPPPTNPIATNPIATNPIATNPIATNPIATNPITTNPITTNPITTTQIIPTPVSEPQGLVGASVELPGLSAALPAPPPPAKDEDNESGQGTSLPQSPHGSLDGTEIPGGLKSIDSDFEDKGFANPVVAFSLCGWELGREVKEEEFSAHQVQYEQLASDPTGVLGDPKLVVRVGRRYVPWGPGQAMLASQILFGRALPEETVTRMMEEMALPSAAIAQTSTLTADEKGKDRESKRSSYSWFSWRRSTATTTTTTPTNTPTTSTPPSEIPSVQSGETSAQTLEPPPPEALPVPSSVHSDEHYAASASSEESDGEAGHSRRNQPGSSPKKLPLDKRPYYTHPTERYRKTLRLSTDQIASLNLREGANEVVFSVTTAYQGTTRCKCHIYRWRYDDRIVVSDIDGTITKSDVLGHILPIIGRDWAQSGVAQLFTKIKNNGYKLLYLSARAIGQARITRDYLRSIKQGDLSLPEGPLLLNPTSLLNAFHREVIEKKPEDFKISCLRDVQALYPMQRNPFYAGYGNKINDVWSYRAVGIPISRIFTINHRGELKHELTQTFQSSYSNLSYIVDHIFPPRVGTLDVCQPSDDYSQFVYWRDPIPELESVASEEPPQSPPSPQTASTSDSPPPTLPESNPTSPPPTPTSPTSPSPPTPLLASPVKAK